MKRIITLVCALLVVAASLSMVACSSSSNSDFGFTPSGYKFALNEAILKISADLDIKEEKDGYVQSAKSNITVEGVSKELSYFGNVKFIWSYEYLSDSGEYVPAVYTATVSLDAEGNGKHKEKVDFVRARSIRNLELTIEYAGYAIRK